VVVAMVAAVQTHTMVVAVVVVHMVVVVVVVPVVTTSHLLVVMVQLEPFVLFGLAQQDNSPVPVLAHRKLTCKAFQSCNK
jgi:hypothetical protein